MIKNNRMGMVLVEALLAVVILGVGITLVVQSLSVSRRNVALSLDYTRGIFIIENQLTSMLLNPVGQLSVDTQGVVDISGRQYTYDFKEEVLTGESSDHLKEMKAEISWKSGKRENVLSVSTMVFTPPNETQN